MLNEFFVEFGTEELPSGFLNTIIKDMPKQVEDLFRSYRITCNGISLFYTPKRIVVHIDELADVQSEQFKEIIGPPARIGFDKKGKPTEAAIGFAKSNSITLNEVEIKETPKGEYLCFKQELSKQSTISLLPGILNELICSVGNSRSMKWDSSGLRFSRPIRWLLSIFGGEIVKFNVGNLESANYTFGHRVKNIKIQVSSYKEFVESLKENDVILDQRERESMIVSGIEKMVCKELALDNAGVLDAELVRDAVNMTEYPKVILGTFSEEFLKLPEEVLITSMKKHQGFFSVSDGEGSLQPYFISVIDINCEDTGLIKKGNEKVLRSRLEDARFFFKEDLRRTLDSRVEDLGKVLFQKKLGTLYDKILRMQKIASVLRDLLDLSDNQFAVLSQAIRLSKTDLLTEMVGEFPTLQGIMGREYLLAANENKQIASAIGEQYLPKFFNDRLPDTITGALLSVVDRIDTITGCFGAGIIPSGSQDPYALRRQAVGVVQIFIEKNIDLSIDAILQECLGIFSGALEHDKKDLLQNLQLFFKGRVEYYLDSKKLRYDVIAAVMSTHGLSPYRAFVIAETLSSKVDSDDFKNLLLSIKRTFNIIPKDKQFIVYPEFLQSHEKDLYTVSLEIKEDVDAFMADKDYKSAINSLAAISLPISDFFDNVMVMSEDQQERENRLAVLQYVHKIFLSIADFSQIVIK